MLYGLVIAVHVISCIILIVAILLQAGRGGGLSETFGGDSSQTIFGTIARELRKYKVTLLIVDQRPSGIDDEVMSQVGSRVTALLDNERDISAVLTGVSGASGLREVLARLDTKQQAIVLGHAVPMPVVIQTRTYDEAFYKAMGAPLKGKALGRAAKRGSKDLYGDEDFEGFD